MKREDAYAILNMVDHIGPVTVRRLMNQFGSPETILNAPESELKKTEGVGPKSAKSIASWKDSVPWEKEFDQIQKQGIRLISQESDEYPVHLKEIHDPPL